MWVNTFGFGCLIVDMVEMGFWKIDEAHSVINKCESPSCPFSPFPHPQFGSEAGALADFIQLWYFLPYTYGKPGPNREHKVVARHFLAEVMEAFMAIPRDIFKRLTDHGKGHDGKGFDETNVSFPSLLFASAVRCCFSLPLHSVNPTAAGLAQVVKEIALRHDAQQLYKQLNGAATSHSVASRSKNYLAEYRQRIGKKDVRAHSLLAAAFGAAPFFRLLISRSCARR